MTAWVEYTTEEEVTDNSICETEPISGTNTLTNGNDSYVYTFDGENDCDEEPTQMLSINGEEAQEVSGVGCATVQMKTALYATLFAFGCAAFRRRNS